MRTFVKNSLRISSCSIIAGFILIIVAICMDNTIFSNLENFNVSIIGSNKFKLSKGHKGESNAKSVMKKEESKDTGNIEEDIKAIYLDISYGTVTIKEGDQFDIKAEDESYVINEICNDGVLEITDSDIDSANNGIYVFGYKINADKPFKASDIELTIPKDYVFEDLDIILGAGSIKAERLIADNVSVDVGAGRLKIESLTAHKESYYSVSAGEIIIDDINAVDVSMNCDVGRLEVSGVIKGDSSVTCGVGDVDLSVDGKEEDYNYHIDCDLGSVKINNKRYSGVSNTVKKNNDVNDSFTLDCGVGNISLKTR